MFLGKSFDNCHTKFETHFQKKIEIHFRENLRRYSMQIKDELVENLEMNF